ncbi:unnamed protein product [Toxocara canis]|uniref:Uncharacterized protein n=1 Tax=Toxocara canis TaxID=6265 RepID=A0A183UJ35_TOXCA|nr:unnamed protein product [Toxocara canis]
MHVFLRLRHEIKYGWELEDEQKSAGEDTAVFRREKGERRWGTLFDPSHISSGYGPDAYTRPRQQLMRDGHRYCTAPTPHAE